MLVLTRRNNERIIIGDIVITLLEAHGGKARIGIEAPKDVLIFREEVLTAIQRTQREATK
jgi:carbon storage regulator